MCVSHASRGLGFGLYRVMLFLRVLHLFFPDRENQKIPNLHFAEIGAEEVEWRS